MGHHKRKLVAAVVAVLCAAVACVVGWISVAMLTPEYSWYKTGDTKNGVYFGTRNVTVCGSLLGETLCFNTPMEDVKKNKLYSVFAEVTDDDKLDKMIDAGKSAFFCTVIGGALVALFGIWMILAIVLHKASIHGRWLGLLGFIVMALSPILWYATRPDLSSKAATYKESDAFYANIAAAAFALISFIVAGFAVGHKRHKGYAKIR